MTMGLYKNAKLKLRRWLLRRLPACRQTVAMISESMEHPLSLRNKLTVKLHLMVCSWCQWYMEHLKTIRETLRSQPMEPAESNFGSSPGLSDEVKERIKKQLVK